MTTSFKQFLQNLEEGAAEDVTNLQQQIADVDVLLARQAKPLQDRKTRLQTMLAQKQKMLDTEQKTPQSGEQQGNQTITPGSTNRQTPGSGMTVSPNSQTTR